MATLVTHEHQRILVGPEFSNEINNPRINNRQYNQIVQLNSHFRKSGFPEPFGISQGSIQAKQYVGVVSFGTDSLEVLPKVDSANSASERVNLIQMLSRTKKLPMAKGVSSKINLRESSFIEYFFMQFLKEVCMQTRQGLLRQYTPQRELLSNLKGKPLISEQLKLGLAKHHQIPCSYDELCVNNPFNQLLKRAIRIIQPHLQQTDSQLLAKQLLWEFNEVSESNSPLDFTNILFDRILKQYEISLRMAEIFVKHAALGIHSGSHQLFSTFFDMNRLFEEYISNSIKRLAPARVLIQQPEKYLAIDSRHRFRFKMRPDILIRGNDGTFDTVVDTKWKLLSKGEPNYGVAHTDIYQLLTYARQYGCNEIALIYPATSSLVGCVEEYQVRTGSERIKILGFDLGALEKTDEQLRSYGLL